MQKAILMDGLFVGRYLLISRIAIAPVRQYRAFHLFDALPIDEPLRGSSYGPVAGQRSKGVPFVLLSFRVASDLIAKKTKAPYFRTGLLSFFDAWQFPTLAWGDPTLPSALRRFTSEFGMGSGGTTALVPPGKFC